MNIKRCSWCSLKNEKYIAYHDYEWGRKISDPIKLYELFILETFVSGLSWECVLNKREAFRKAFDGFDPQKVSSYGEEKISELMNNKDIIRNRKKLEAAVINTKIYLDTEKSFGSFNSYIESFAGKDIIYENDRVKSPLSDKISADLKKRGMRFTGSVTVYSFLQAAGYIYSHEKGCFMEHK